MPREYAFAESTICRQVDYHDIARAWAIFLVASHMTYGRVTPGALQAIYRIAGDGVTPARARRLKSLSTIKTPKSCRAGRPGRDAAAVAARKMFVIYLTNMPAIFIT